MPRNVLLLVVDSLRSDVLGDPRDTPFLSGLYERALFFSRAYATECWTLPSHMSMFTGLLARQHGAHFGHMAYTGSEPTIAEVLAAEGYATEAVTRNFVFDGSIEGVLRGFERKFTPVSEGPRSVANLFLALAKPRIRRHVETTGFFSAEHLRRDGFIPTFARTLLPADEIALEVVLERMVAHRETERPFFIFANLYDVHAPYPPRCDSLLRPWSSFAGWEENLLVPYSLAQLGGHRYLREGFCLPDRIRRLLVERYHEAVRLMDRKLQHFFGAADDAGLLDNTLVVLTSDHGEAFGEHGLYLHDGSVYETHLHVPLWIFASDGESGIIDDVVSTRALFHLMKAYGQETSLEGTMLDGNCRGEFPYAEADHFHYPHLDDAAPRYKLDQQAVIAAQQKLVTRGGEIYRYDLDRDAAESNPERIAYDPRQIPSKRVAEVLV